MAIGALNELQARYFRNQGYLRVPSVYDDAAVQELRAFIDTEARAARSQQQGRAILKIYDLYKRDRSLMGRTVTTPNLIGPLQSLLGPHIVFVTNRHNVATINDQRGAPAEGLHRDILQATRGLVTAAVYLDDSTVENGATRLIPGSHDFPYVGVPQPQGGGTWMSEHEEYAGMEDQAVSVPVPQGGVLLFNGLTFHGVGENMTGQPRRSIILGFRSVDELDPAPDATRQILVSGEQIYRGNDALPI